jgi:ankyrin repeat protein
MRPIAILCTLLASLLASGCGARAAGTGASPPDASLHEAMRGGKVAAVQRLLAAGADPDAVVDDETGEPYTPLGAALRDAHSVPDGAGAGVEEMVRALLQAGADPDLAFGRPGDEATALWLALRSSPEVVRLLLAAGADPNLGGCYGYSGGASTPLHTAEDVGGPELVALLREAGALELTSGGAGFAIARSGAGAPLHAAVFELDAAAVERLLRSGGDPNAVIEGLRVASGEVDRYSPLRLALEARYGPDGDGRSSAEMVRLLLAAGADPDEPFSVVCSDERPTPLLLAAGRGEADVVKLLLEAGADPNSAAGRFGGVHVPPLVMAAGEGMPEVARLLLEAGADPNVVVEADGGRFTALDVALSQRHAEVVALLRAAGGAEAAPAPDPALPDGFGEAFAACTPGATFTSSLPELGAAVRYDVVGPEGARCRLSMTFEANPNPAWENTPLTFTLDPGAPFMPQLEAVMQRCLGGGRGGDYGCAGPLLELLRP